MRLTDEGLMGDRSFSEAVDGQVEECCPNSLQINFGKIYRLN